MPMPRELQKIHDALWELPVTFREGMRVPVRVYATESLVGAMEEIVFRQAANVATLKGIVGYSFCMPDGHSGYGFPIGGTAAFDPAEGVISPGGIGFDINCGMRLMRTSLTLEEVRPRLEELVDRLFARIPSGVGGKGFLKLSRDEFRELTETGARWCVKHGYGTPQDLERTEEEGCMSGADAGKVSDRAVERGHHQVGTLGSGNHYLEIQVAREEEVSDPEAARVFGITGPDQVLVMLHCGSRGFGHQIATDYLKVFLESGDAPAGDRELAAAPFRSPRGQDYFAAMKCAVNMAFANRQMIIHGVREVFSDLFHRPPADLGMDQVYDVTHNTAKLESHLVEGRERELLVHRKGATRAFGPRMEGIPSEYREVGQPVIIGGSMETGSYLLVGTGGGAQTFYTTAHGSGRTMSRRQAKKSFSGKKLLADMAHRGTYVRTASYGGLAEEAGKAYKDIDQVVEATALAGISRPVARLVPIGNIKG
ncbi:MAG: RtcB family protein [Spirochaetota bacterium]